MDTCPVCDKETRPNTTICPACGTDLSFFREVERLPQSFLLNAQKALENGDDATALSYYSLALEIKGNDPELLKKCARSRESVGDKTGALHLWQKLKAAFPGDQLAESRIEALTLPEKKATIEKSSGRSIGSLVTAAFAIVAVFWAGWGGHTWLAEQRSERPQTMSVFASLPNTKSETSIKPGVDIPRKPKTAEKRPNGTPPPEALSHENDKTEADHINENAGEGPFTDGVGEPTMAATQPNSTPPPEPLSHKGDKTEADHINENAGEGPLTDGVGEPTMAATQSNSTPPPEPLSHKGDKTEADHINENAEKMPLTEAAGERNNALAKLYDSIEQTLPSTVRIEPCDNGIKLAGYVDYPWERQALEMSANSWACDFADLRQVVVKYPRAFQYRVRKGDSLFKLSRRFTDRGASWPKLLELNRDTVADPNRLKIGEIVILLQDDPI